MADVYNIVPTEEDRRLAVDELRRRGADTKLILRRREIMPVVRFYAECIAGTKSLNRDCSLTDEDLRDYVARMAELIK